MQNVSILSKNYLNFPGNVVRENEPMTEIVLEFNRNIIKSIGIYLYICIDIKKKYIVHEATSNTGDRKYKYECGKKLQPT